MNISYTIVSFENTMKTRDAEKIRGYIGHKYAAENILHNHNIKGYIYRYPLIQYKVINKSPIICGLREGAETAVKIGLEVDQMLIQDQLIQMPSKQIRMEEVAMGITDDYINYKFLTPWIALNDTNIKKYIGINTIQKEEMLRKILIGNTLAFSKGMSYTVDKPLHAWIDLRPIDVHLKNIQMVGFIGEFKINYKFPEMIGLGKSVSRGFGTIRKL